MDALPHRLHAFALLRARRATMRHHASLNAISIKKVDGVEYPAAHRQCEQIIGAFEQLGAHGGMIARAAENLWIHRQQPLLTN